jgi:hypothetical protein
VINEGENFELSIEAVSSDSINYQWFKDSTLLQGFNAEYIIKNNAELNDSGIYYCEITNECGMVKSKEINLIINPINSVYEELPGEYSISPNPARDYIEISSINPTLKSGVDDCSAIQIFNTLGEIFMSVEQTSSSVQRIDVSHLAPGIYFIKIGNRVERFVKM